MKNNEKQISKKMDESSQNAALHSKIEEEKFLKKKLRDITSHEELKSAVMEHQLEFIKKLQAKYSEL